MNKFEEFLEEHKTAIVIGIAGIGLIVAIKSASQNTASQNTSNLPQNVTTDNPAADLANAEASNAANLASQQAQYDWLFGVTPPSTSTPTTTTPTTPTTPITTPGSPLAPITPTPIAPITTTPTQPPLWGHVGQVTIPGGSGGLGLQNLSNGVNREQALTQSTVGGVGGF